MSPGIISKMIRRQFSGYDQPRRKPLLGYKFWKGLSYYVAFPAIGLCMINVIYMSFIDEKHQTRPEFIKYDYMYKRDKRFPWGDGNKSLFHNRHTNALPDGYEDEH